MTLGVYPDVSLAQARERHQDGRRLLTAGVDPMVDRKQQASAPAATTFEQAARQWWAHWSPSRSTRHAARGLPPALAARCGVQFPLRAPNRTFLEQQMATSTARRTAPKVPRALPLPGLQRHARTRALLGAYRRARPVHAFRAADRRRRISGRPPASGIVTLAGYRCALARHTQVSHCGFLSKPQCPSGEIGRHKGLESI